jgi:hypothetical protein
MCGVPKTVQDIWGLAIIAFHCAGRECGARFHNFVASPIRGSVQVAASLRRTKIDHCYNDGHTTFKNRCHCVSKDGVHQAGHAHRKLSDS